MNESTVDYIWMEANLPVYGDGDTYYYFQKPIYENEWEDEYGVTYPEYRTDWGGEPPAWSQSEERWDRFYNGSGYEQMEEVNWLPNNLGKLKGTNLQDLCDLVGGLPPGQTVRVIAKDNLSKDIPYSAVYSPNPHLGPYVITWWSVDAGESGATSGYTGPDYTNGMRGTFFADDSRNSAGKHVAGLGDMVEGLPEEFWYYFIDPDAPSLGGYTVKYINRIYVYSNDPIPPPQADFKATVETGRIVNGDFETKVLTPWTGSGASIYSSTNYNYRNGNASVKLAASASNSAWISQSIDLTGISTINFYRAMLGGTGKYLQVYVDATMVANYSETTTVYSTDIIDISSYGFTGNHTIKFSAVNTLTGGFPFQVYLDDITDYGPGTSGDAPLTIQFQDLSSKMEDTSNTSWAWDFQNDGTIDSTEQNPLFTYTTNGSYTVKLTATNANGSATEIKAGYINVGAVTPPEFISFTVTDYNGDGIKFGSLDPGQSDQPADGQPSQGAVTITVGTETNVDVDVKVTGTDFTVSGNTIAVGNVKYNDENDSGGATALTTSYATWYSVSASPSSDHVTQVYYWITIPPGQPAGDYASTFSYKAEKASP